MRRLSGLSNVGALFACALAWGADNPAPASPTDVSLREYVDIRFQAQEAAVNAALAAADRAVAKAEAASDKRFESVNEFRASLDDLNRLQMPRLEAEQAIRGQNEKIEDLTARVSATEDRSKGISATWLMIIALLGVLTSVGSLMLTFSRNPKKVEHFDHANPQTAKPA